MVMNMELTKTRLESYLKLLDGTYFDCVNVLILKYGEVKDDYYRERSYNRFLNDEIKNISKGKYSRATEGLECHHINEYKCIDLSNKEAIRHFQYPFDLQKKENLVYCDIFEHLILHTLIIKETNGEYGVGGNECFLRPKIEDWLIKGKKPKPQWMRACIERAYLSIKETKSVLYRIDEVLEPYYQEKKRKLEIELQEIRNIQKKEWADELGMTVLEFEAYEKQEKLERERKREEEEKQKLKDFFRKFPNFKELNIDPGTSRKKILDMLYEYKFKSEYSRKKEFYESMKKFYKDELFSELNSYVEQDVK